MSWQWPELPSKSKLVTSFPKDTDFRRNASIFGNESATTDDLIKAGGIAPKIYSGKLILDNFEVVNFTRHFQTLQNTYTTSHNI